eukprot:SAG11_NODE_1071_length_5977_cov_27.273562_3_plen_74_part_00
MAHSRADEPHDGWAIGADLSSYVSKLESCAPAAGHHLPPLTRLLSHDAAPQTRITRRGASTPGTRRATASGVR